MENNVSEHIGVTFLRPLFVEPCKLSQDLPWCNSFIIALKCVHTLLSYCNLILRVVCMSYNEGVCCNWTYVKIDYSKIEVEKHENEAFHKISFFNFLK